jgi:hypothetical protein
MVRSEYMARSNTDCFKTRDDRGTYAVRLRNDSHIRPFQGLLPEALVERTNGIYGLLDKSVRWHLHSRKA